MSVLGINCNQAAYKLLTRCLACAGVDFYHYMHFSSHAVTELQCAGSPLAGTPAAGD